jgi:lysophospholipase L1-like esterase
VKQNGSYFFQSFIAILLAAICFLVFQEFLPKRIFAEVAVPSKNVVVDSFLLESVAQEKVEIKKEPIVDTFYRKKIVFEKIDGIVYPPEDYEEYKGFQYLIPYFEKLYQLETQKSGDVRIAYFGDSMTDGDLIVQDFRYAMQAQFGGQGVGFVSITSESAKSRSSISHQYSGNWKTQSYLNIKRPLNPFGVNGHVFFANDTISNAWVQYKAGYGKFTNQLNNPALFYGKSNNETAELLVKIGNDTLVKKLNGEKSLNVLPISNTNLKSFKASFKEADSIPIYGFNFDDGKGVHVDNFSNRGNSGLPISTFSTSMMRQFQERLDYDLIILHYGTNVLNYGTYNYDWYEKSMTKVVNHLKECFPGVTILVISSADKSTKYELEMKTDSAVVPLTNAQRKYAVQSKAGYFNLYKAMGGEGSMALWAEENPPMANKDYTHFNYKGAQKVAGLLFDQLQTGYAQYKQMRNNRIIVPKKTKTDSVQAKIQIINEKP